MRRFFCGLWRLIRGNVPVLLFLVILCALLYGFRTASDTSRAEAKRIAEDSIRRAVVSCYALEGRYPDSYEYLRDHYGLRIDEDRCIIHYEVVASNIMPDITVIERVTQ